jgi:hypothetical protein
MDKEDKFAPNHREENSFFTSFELPDEEIKRLITPFVRFRYARHTSIGVEAQPHGCSGEGTPQQGAEADFTMAQIFGRALLPTTSGVRPEGRTAGD